VAEHEIATEDLDWAHAEVREGRPHGTVVSVRLSAAEADRLRDIADHLGLNLSQVLRRALADYEPADDHRQGIDVVWSRGFTVANQLPTASLVHWLISAVAEETMRWAEDRETGTEPIRITERVRT